MKLCDVRTFDLGDSKTKALKPLEEAAEVFGSFQKREKRISLFAQWGYEDEDAYDGFDVELKDECLYELADCVTACCNMAASLGCEDLTPYLMRVEESNEERGRYE